MNVIKSIPLYLNYIFHITNRNQVANKNEFLCFLKVMFNLFLCENVRLLLRIKLQIDKMKNERLEIYFLTASLKYMLIFIT